MRAKDDILSARYASSTETHMWIVQTNIIAKMESMTKKNKIGTEN